MRVNGTDNNNPPTRPTAEAIQTERFGLDDEELCHDIPQK